MVEDDHEETFELTISIHPDGVSEVRTQFSKDDSGGNDDGSTPPPHPTGIHGLSDGQLSKEFARLASDWTALAISFFEVVPAMSFYNYMVAEVGNSETITKYAKSRSLSSDTFEGDEGVTHNTYTLPIRELSVLAKKLGKAVPSRKAARTLGRATLAALVAEYEAFMTQLLGLVSAKRPSAFVSEDDQISLRELGEYDSIEKARQAIMEAKIEDLLHEKSHFELLKWIESKFNVNLTQNEKLISEFVEVCQRRHVIMHGGGVASRRYVKNCRQASFDEAKLAKTGDRLSVGRKYLRQSTSRVFQVGFFTLHILWQKLLPKFSKDSVQSILESSHEFIDNDLTKMTRRVCDFVLDSKTPMSDKHRAYLVINRAQSYLFDPDLDEQARSEGTTSSLALKDWSVVTPVLQLALACINRDYSNLRALSVAARGFGLQYYAVQTWSIFREVRENPEFLDAFLGEELKSQSSMVMELPSPS